MASNNIRKGRQLALVAAIPLFAAGLPMTAVAESDSADTSVLLAGKRE